MCLVGKVDHTRAISAWRSLPKDYNVASVFSPMPGAYPQPRRAAQHPRLTAFRTPLLYVQILLNSIEK